MNSQQVNGERTLTQARIRMKKLSTHTHTQICASCTQIQHTPTHGRLGQFHLPLSSHTIEIFVAYFQAICLQLKLPKKNLEKIPKKKAKKKYIPLASSLKLPTFPPPLVHSGKLGLDLF